MRKVQNYRVCLSSKKGKVNPNQRGECLAYYNIQSSSPEKAIECAKRHCIVLYGKIDGVAWLATPEECGCS